MRLIREIRHIPARTGHQKLIILRPARQDGPVPGILWIHGGGYMTGMAAMVYGSCGRMLARKYGAVVVSPGYRLAWKKPYPAALEDCYTALEYMADHAEELGIRDYNVFINSSADTKELFRQAAAGRGGLTLRSGQEKDIFDLTVYLRQPKRFSDLGITLSKDQIDENFERSFDDPKMWNQLPVATKENIYPLLEELL